MSGSTIACHTRNLSRLSFSGIERFIEREGRLLDVEEDAPNGASMAILQNLIRGGDFVKLGERREF
jgi:hypothetical protein